MKPKYEYRHENHGDQWQEFLGNTWSIEDVAHTVAEEYWDLGDGDCDANDFNLMVEVRAVDEPEKYLNTKLLLITTFGFLRGYKKRLKMSAKTTTQYTCDLCENVTEVGGVTLPSDWGIVEVKVSWSSGTWATGIVCNTCLESSNVSFPSMKDSGRIAAKIYKLFCGKQNKWRN